MGAEGPSRTPHARDYRKFFYEIYSLEMPFSGLWRRFDRILMVRKQRYSMSKFTICLEFSSTKWAKAYLINYILDKLQENMGNIFILCSLS